MATRARPLQEAHPLPSDHPDYGGMLAVDTEADARRAVLVARAFLDALQQDSRVVGLYAVWRRQIGIPPRLPAARAARVDAAVGPLMVSGWSERLDPTPWRFVADVLGLSRPLGAGRDAWLWLAIDLLRWFERDVLSRSLGVPGVRIVPSIGEPLRAPTLKQNVSRVFASGAPDYVLDVYARRWLDRDRSVPEASRTLGRQPKADTAYLHDWAAWLYALDVRQPPSTVAALAREYLTHRAAPDVGVKSAERTIRTGRATARRLLESIRF